MDNNSGTLLGYILLILALSMIILIITEKDKKKKHKKHKHPKLRLRIYFQNKINHFCMASINSITLTDAQLHTGLITVVDDAGNSYTGTLGNVSVAVADPTQDTAVVDPNVPNTIDVQEANPTGGTTAIVTADFTSQGNAIPSNPTAQPILDGTVFPGLSVQIVMINKVSANLKLQVTF